MSIASFNFKLSTEIEYGCGSLKKLSDKIFTFNTYKAMIITDQGIVKVGILEKITEQLSQAKVPFTVFDQVEPDPSTKTIEEITFQAKNEGVEILIAVGGGSPIDAAKGTNILLGNGGELFAYGGINKVNKKGLPLIAIPTTAGTGSEVTIFAVLRDIDRNLKFTITSPLIAPDLALLDPELTLSLPPMITGATGMDALTHAVEAYTSVKSNSLSDMLAIEAIRLIFRYLPRAVCNGKDLEARSEMFKAQLLAGIAFNNAFLGLSHAIASPLGSHFHISHGVANSILLPHVMKFNVPALPEKYAQITSAMGVALNGRDIYEDAFESYKAVERLAKMCNLPDKLRNVGAREDLLNDVAEDALKSGMLKLNVRKADQEHIRQILQEAF
ncbi:MAG: iron-containing alcohol dehydrogenase [Bacillota bacterium]